MKMEHEAAGAMLGSKPKMPPKPKPRKTFHAEELHDGSYSVKKGHTGMTEPMMEEKQESAPDLDGVHDKLEEHMGGKNEGEEEMEKEKAGGTPHPQEE
jgi:hypothetical protein